MPGADPNSFLQCAKDQMVKSESPTIAAIWRWSISSIRMKSLNAKSDVRQFQTFLKIKVHHQLY